MSAEDFELIDDRTIDNSIMKIDIVKVYHQHGAQVDDETQNIKFYFGEKFNFFFK